MLFHECNVDISIFGFKWNHRQAELIIRNNKILRFLYEYKVKSIQIYDIPSGNEVIINKILIFLFIALRQMLHHRHQWIKLFNYFFSNHLNEELLSEGNFNFYEVNCYLLSNLDWIVLIWNIIFFLYQLYVKWMNNNDFISRS